MNQLEKAIHNLGLKRTIHFNNQVFKLVCLIREEDKRPFQATWWKKKEVTLIAVDERGHFFLRHANGSVFSLDPVTKKEESIVKSEKEFINMIDWDE